MLLLIVFFAPTVAVAGHRHHHHAAKRCKAARKHHQARTGTCRHVRPVLKRDAGGPNTTVGPQPTLPAACRDADLVPASGNLDPAAGALLCLVNQQRAAHGLGALTPDAALTRAAAAHTAEMVSSNYFAHPSLDGTSSIGRLLASGFVPAGGSYLVGENLGWGLGALAAPATVVDGWMHSPTHRANILNGAFNKSGIGVLAAVPAVLDSSGRTAATYTQDFGARR